MTHPDSMLLSAHLDGDLDPQQSREIEDHLSGCASCTTLFRELQEVQERARNLPDRYPDRDLWPRIASAILGSARESDVIALHPWRGEERPARKGRGFRITYLQAAAAVVALSFFSGAAGSLLAGWAPSGAETSRQASNPWVTMVEAASPGLHLPALEVIQLEELLAAHRDELDPGTVVVLERNLAVIDRAIQECVQALETDPGNEFLEGHLAQAVRAKADFLREATALVAPVG